VEDLLWGIALQTFLQEQIQEIEEYEDKEERVAWLTLFVASKSAVLQDLVLFIFFVLLINTYVLFR
jgi:hypothetical protein